MSRSYPRFKAAACHAARCFSTAAKTADKACDLIAEASRNGAKLVVFPESFIPGFPVWAALQAPIHSHEFFAALAGEAVRLDGPEIEKVRMAARRHGVVVSLGITEGTDASVGCLWNSNILIGTDGAIINHHRKLVPTFYEKLDLGERRRPRLARGRDRDRAPRHADLRREHQSARPLHA